jgi:ABC-type transport system involved in cytochrome c biogenesis permease subunit
MKYLLLVWVVLAGSLVQAGDSFVFEEMKTAPVMWKGRLRPFDAYSRLWVYEHAPELKSLPPEGVLWRLHFLQSGVPVDVVADGLTDVQRQQLVALSWQSAGEILTMLHGRDGSWLPLRILYEGQSGSKGIYEAYQAMRVAVLKQDNRELERQGNALAAALKVAYVSLAGTPMMEAEGKSLLYPTERQLWGESIYYRIPLIPLAIALYAAASILFLIAMRSGSRAFSKSALIVMLLAFILHTSILVMRWMILSRPPVSNMFETVIYVPWVVVLMGLVLRRIYKSDFILLAASLASLALLIVLQVTKLNSSMEVVQAVLDSQYWLIVHVLMVVGSYGLFILGGVLGHIYLVLAVKSGDSQRNLVLGKGLLQALYIGTAMLICGTILGGVWAAQSWGRFWDWDPKESWAFISSCIYLIIIHAYRFHYISYFGLAVGSIIGLQAISFTWYGVNYILGTGLHSYGFGSGGELFYYLFIAAEVAFLSICARKCYSNSSLLERRDKMRV